MDDIPRQFDTQAVSGDEQTGQPTTGDIVTPIHLASTYTQEQVSDYPEFTYARDGTPTRAALESQLASLSGGSHALALSSGMGAIGTTAMTLLEPGDHVVAFQYLYGGTRKLFDDIYAESFDLDVEYVDATSTAAVADAVTDETALVWVESPTNPLMRLCDIGAIAEVADKADATLCVDNTFASPYFQRPLDLGADVVVHSTTKYINGHSDSLGGAIVTRDDDFAERAEFVQKYGTGSVLSAFDSYMVLRGLKTLPARMERHEQNALAVAGFLDSHSAVEAVHYPGLPSHPQHDLAREQMSGFGGMLSFEIDGGREAAATVLGHLEEIQLAVSLGGVESIIASVPGMTHAYLTDEKREAMDISEGLVRMSVGIEATDDIIRDLERGFDRLS
ncbi:trans-sulfuration enzyme family protein [Halovenus salina]|uniref:Trans-sulfuration enzyme family protein n=1 Tax=Halovenus salina TaxID=1510225 RepID=A0ABD5W612_9EURY|nr:PLP-dependent aspartate aminotransferase family protein [Halovenus salina]